MKLIKTLSLSLAAAGLMALNAQAVQIQGSIGFTGEYAQVGGTPGNLMTATSFTISDVSVQTDNGDLNGSTNPSFLSPIAGNGSNLVGSQLWSVTTGPKTFTFQVTSSSQILNNPNAVSFSGLGTMDDGLGGLEPTTGEWQLGFGVSGSGTNASFTWQSTAATIPDGGATVMLLGAALAGLAFVRRRLLA